MRRCAPRGCSRRPTATTVTPRAPCLCPTPRRRICPRRSNRRMREVPSRCLNQSAATAWWCPGSAPTPLSGARLARLRAARESQRDRWEDYSWAAGFEYHHHHQQQQRHKRQLNATSPSIHTTPRTRPSRVTSAPSLARSRAGSRAAAQPACRAMPTRTHRGRESRARAQELTESRDP